MVLKHRSVALFGPLVAMLALSPAPSSLRIPAALLVVLLAVPVGLWPAWRSRLIRKPPPDETGGDAGLTGLAAGAAGLVVFSAIPLLLFTILGLAGVGVGALVIVHLGFVALAAGLGWRFAGKVDGHPGSREAGPLSGGPGVRAEVVALLLGLSAVLVFTLRHGAPLGPGDDAYDHLYTVRHLVESGRVEFPGAAYARELPRGLDPRKGVMHVGLALAARMAGADPIAVWRWTPAITGPMVALAFAALSLALFARRWSALAGILSLLILWNDPAWLLKSAYGGHWGLAVAWAGAALVMAGGGVGVAVVAGAAAAAVHAYSPAQLMAPLVVERGLALVWRGPPPRYGVRQLGGLLAGAIPVEAARWMLAGPTSNPLHGQSMEWLVLPPGPVASPLQLLSWYGYAGVAAALLLVPMIVWRDRAGRFLVACALAPAVLLLNPWLFAAAGKAVGSVANKVAFVWVYPLALTWLAYAIVDALSGRRAIRLVVLGVLGLVVAGAAMPGLRLRFESPVPGDPPWRDLRLSPALELIRSHTPPHAVIASDPATSYAIPALTGRRVIVTLHQHAPPGDARAVARLRVATELFSTCVPLERAAGEAVAEGAEYLLQPGSPPYRLDQYASHVDPRNSAGLASRFAGCPRLLEPVSAEGGAVLYRIRAVPAGAGSADSGGCPAIPEAGAAAPAGPWGGSVELRAGPVSVGVQSLSFSSARRGEEVRIPVQWRIDLEEPGYSEYLVHLRFENESLPVARGDGLLGKPLRRLFLEPRAGGSFRWRAVEMPFRGLCPVWTWPTGKFLPDTLEFQVPEQLIPGTYVLRASLEEGALYPRLDLADLLSDTDRFSGPAVGRLIVE